MEQQLLQYGALGILVLALFIAIRIIWHENLAIRKEHKQEREEWRQTINKQFEETEERDKEMKDLLSEIKRALERNNQNNRRS